MNISKHSKIRSQQGGINEDVIEMILTHGTTKHRPGNAQEYRIHKRQKSDLISTYKRKIRLLENIDKKCVLLSDDGNILTVYNSTN